MRLNSFAPHPGVEHGTRYRIPFLSGEERRTAGGTPTCIILPIHDAVLVECDQADIEQVAREASLIMTGAVRAYFPELSPRVDVNTKTTSCWSKDGHEDSLDNFRAMPESG